MDEQANAVEPRPREPYRWISEQTGRPINLILSRSALWIVLLPMLVYFFADVFFETFANSEIVVPAPDTLLLPESEAAGRYFFLASYLALIAITTGVCLYFRSDVRSILDRPSRRSVWLVGIVLICMLGYSVVARGGDSPKTYNFVGQALFAKALCAAPLPPKPGLLTELVRKVGEYFVAPDTIEKTLCRATPVPSSMASVFVPLQKIDDIFIVVAVPALILGCVSALARSVDDVAFDTEVHILSVQVRRVKAYLYLSALVLLAIIILTVSWMTFPSYLLTGDAAKRYDTLVHSISAYYGLQYVFILCSYYVPVSLILSGRIRGLAYRAMGTRSQAPNEQTLEEWEQKSGLLLNDLRSYKTIAALLAPLFPGLIGAVLAVAGK